MPWLRTRPTVCLLSHTHWDHIGSAHEFVERLAHPAEAGILADPTNTATLAEKYAKDDPAVEAQMFTRLPPGWRGSEYRLLPAPATRFVDEGDVIDLGDRQLAVLHTPGHSPGHVSLFEEKTGILFAADVVYDGPLVDTLYHSDKPTYRARCAGCGSCSRRSFTAATSRASARPATANSSTRISHRVGRNSGSVFRHFPAFVSK